MSEGFVITSATDANDLLNQIVGQAVARGWVQQHLSGLGGIGRRAHISKDGLVVNLASAPSQPPVLNGDTQARATMNAIIPQADRRNQDWNWWYSTYNQNVGYFYQSPGYLAISAGTGYDGGLAWYSQPGSDYDSEANKNYGNFNIAKTDGAIGKVWMFFFENPVGLVIIWEARPGQFMWMAAGNLEKDYDFQGGQYYGASFSMVNPTGSYSAALGVCQVRIADSQVKTNRANGWGGSYVTYPDFNTYPDDRNVPQVPGYSTYIYTSNANNPNQMAVGEPQRSYDDTTGRVWLHPARAYGVRTDIGHSYLGVVGDVYYTTTRAFVGGETIDLGGEQYMVFPFNARVSPYNWDVDNMANDAGWYTRNNFGAGMAIRKPQ